MKFIDLTHIFGAHMPVYPGDKAPELTQTATIKKDGFVHFEIKTGMHVGTHIDAPMHMLEGGKRLSEISVEHFCGNGVLVDATGAEAIDVDCLEGVALQKGDIVLVMTDFDEHFGEDEYFESFPQITEAFAKRLIEAGVKMVGMDTGSPDGPPFLIHKLLLSHGILILENLTNLEALKGVASFEVFAFPPKFHADGSPVRVVAKVA